LAAVGASAVGYEVYHAQGIGRPPGSGQLLRAVPRAGSTGMPLARRPGSNRSQDRAAHLPRPALRCNAPLSGGGRPWET
jgi:hypothetical protein